MTDALCREGIRRAARSLRLAFHDGHHAAAREDMSLASLFGGLALANAGLGAVHGFAGPIGGMFSAPHGAICAALLSQAYAVMGEKDLALKEAERATMLDPPAKDAVRGPAMAENLALIQMIFGENSRAIAILTQLLQTPYNEGLYGIPITSALLRLDPLWDPLRADPAFQKLCQEKQP